MHSLAIDLYTIKDLPRITEQVFFISGCVIMKNSSSLIVLIYYLKKSIYHREHGEKLLILKQNKDHRGITKKVNRVLSACFTVRSLCPLWFTAVYRIIGNGDSGNRNNKCELPIIDKNSMHSL